MELITFESKAYRELVHKIEKIADFVFQKESIPGTELPEVWLDSLELSQVLNVSTRTLQRLRKENLISYTMLRGKCLYKLSEIERGLNERTITCDPHTLEEFHRNYLLK